LTQPSLDVLLVEDDDADALLVEDLLAISGAPLALKRAHTLAAASAMVPDSIDCVLLDLALPDAEGLHALHHLRSRPDAPAIIVLTGLDDERRGAEAVANGAQDYLVKGQVDGGLLARSIRYAVERRRAEQIQQQLQAARLIAAENARLERGLLATPLVDEAALGLATHYQPGRRRALLGGDFYDAVQRADGSVHAVIADVCGHGPDEAALGVCLRVAWRTLVLAGVGPDPLLATLQEILEHERHEESVFTTLCMATVDVRGRRAELRVAGHPPPLVLVGDEVTPIEVPRPGPPLGVIEDARWAPQTLELPPGWALLLYTDGLVEGRRGDGRLGEEGLSELVATARRAGAEPWGLLRNVVERAEELNGGPLVDDAAALLLAER
jgi:serine phosphatase RsbU (regulator of sigma subunit)